MRFLPAALSNLYKKQTCLLRYPEAIFIFNIIEWLYFLMLNNLAAFEVTY